MAKEVVLFIDSDQKIYNEVSSYIGSYFELIYSPPDITHEQVKRYVPSCIIVHESLAMGMLSVLKQFTVTATLPVIVFTESTTTEQVIQYMQRGAVNILPHDKLSCESIYTVLTDTIRLSHQIHQKEKLYETVVTYTESFVWEINYEGFIEYISDSIENVIGHKALSIIGKSHFYDFVPPQDLDIYRGEFSNFTILEKSFKRIAHQLVHKDGTKIWVESSGIIKYNEEGNFIGYEGITVDITPYKTREKEAKEANEILEHEMEEVQLKAERAYHTNSVKDQFISCIYQEIAPPLNGILGMTELLLDSNTTQTKDREYIQDIDYSAKNLQSIVKGLIDLTKTEVNHSEKSKTTFDLHETIKTTSDSLIYKIQQKGLTLDYSYDSELPVSVWGDSTHIRQLLFNLLGNSIQYTNKGTISISVTGKKYTQDCDFTITITDTGIGMSKDLTESLLREFSPHRAEEKLGFGLRITKQVIQQLDGKIDIRSEEGGGTTISVSITLPFGKDEHLEEHTDLDLNGKHIIAADDDPITLRILQEIITRSHGQFTGVCSGDAILDELTQSIDKNKTCYDFIILDYNMPGLDGFETALEIKLDDVLSQIPMIMLSAEDNSLYSPTDDGSPFIGWLKKPIKVDVLKNTIYSALCQNSCAPIEKYNKYVLLVEDNLFSRRITLKALHTLGCIVDIAENTDTAVKKITHENYDMVLLNDSLSTLHNYDFISHIRSSEYADNSHKNILVSMLAEHSNGNREKLLDLGINDIIEKPITQVGIVDVFNKYF